MNFAMLSKDVVLSCSLFTTLENISAFTCRPVSSLVMKYNILILIFVEVLVLKVLL
jgi:hypothetical protein